MVPEIRVLHGGEIAREVARDLASCLASRSRPTRVFEMADYLTSGFDIVDVSDAPETAPETSPETASHAYVLVVETAEFENPADGAVTLLRDLLAANKKSKTTPRRWAVRSVETSARDGVSRRRTRKKRRLRRARETRALRGGRRGGHGRDGRARGVPFETKLRGRL